MRSARMIVGAGILTVTTVVPQMATTPARSQAIAATAESSLAPSRGLGVVPPGGWRRHILVSRAKSFGFASDVGISNRTAVMVWDGNQGIFAQRRLAGIGWGTRVALGSGFFPRVAVNDRGDIAVAWQTQVSPLRDEVQVALRRASGRWGRAVTLMRGAVFSGPQVAIGARGKVTVAVPAASRDGQKPRVLVFTHRRRWSRAVPVSNPRAAAVWLPIVVAGRGRATVAWRQGANGERWCATRSHRGRWEAPTCHPGSLSEFDNLGMAIDDTGRVYLTDGNAIWSRAPGRRRAWRREVAPPAKRTCDPISAIDAAGRGRAAVLWTSGCSGRFAKSTDSKLLIRRPTGIWTVPRLREPMMGGLVAITDTGAVRAVYPRPRGLITIRKPPSEPWGPPIRLQASWLNTPAGVAINVNSPAGVAINDRGATVIGWEHSHPDGTWDLWAGWRARG